METSLIPLQADALDFLLEQLSLMLQLPESKYRNAEDRYHAVGAWLAEPGSPLRGLDPDIYPQGSMLLQTTVKPRVGDEYDLDLVCHLKVARSVNPLMVYEMVKRRLGANEKYTSILRPKKRCLRLDYSGDFHLDILPACPDVDRGGTCILVPDRELGQWTESNPKGYGEWFTSRCKVAEARAVAKAAVEPLPGNGSGEFKPTLKRAVQLLKRHRDVVFGDDDRTPRSIVLTTLAGHSYGGELLCMDALLGIARRVNEAVSICPGILEVRNPTNPDELFSETWDAASYTLFVAFMWNFQARLERLGQIRGMKAIAEALNELFGEEPTRRAIDAYSQRYAQARESGSLRVGGPAATLGVGAAVGRAVPRHTFYGR